MIGDALGSVSVFDTIWLRRALTAAAAQAGYHAWWQADDLVEGIALHLRTDDVDCVVDSHHLEKMVRGVLRDVGYEEVAAHFHTRVPYQCISLAQCFLELPQHGHVEFFDALAERIRRLQATNTMYVHFSELQTCVRGLLQIPTAVRCDDHRLVSEVVVFVREKVRSLFQQKEIWCSIT